MKHALLSKIALLLLCVLFCCALTVPALADNDSYFYISPRLTALHNEPEYVVDYAKAAFAMIPNTPAFPEDANWKTSSRGGDYPSWPVWVEDGQGNTLAEMEVGFGGLVERFQYMEGYDHGGSAVTLTEEETDAVITFCVEMLKVLNPIESQEACDAYESNLGLTVESAALADGVLSIRLVNYSLNTKMYPIGVWFECLMDAEGQIFVYYYTSIGNG